MEYLTQHQLASRLHVTLRNMEAGVKQQSTQHTYYATLKRRGLVPLALKPTLSPHERRLLRQAKRDSERRSWVEDK